jgi:hypothetical protein
MAPMLYWIVYHLDLGRLGLKVLDLAVQSWLNRANKPVAAPFISTRTSAWMSGCEAPRRSF